MTTRQQVSIYLLIFGGVLAHQFLAPHIPNEVSFVLGSVLGAVATVIRARIALTRKDHEYRRFFSDVIRRIEDQL